MLTSGSGEADLLAANDPKLFTDPVSLSYADLNVTRGAASKSLLLAVADAGDGAGTWTVEVRSQSQPSGVEIVVPGAITLAPGGDLQVPVTARAAGGAGTGEAYGYLLLRRGDVTRKVPYAMLVTRPGLAQVPILPLSQFQTGDTSKGVSRASAYRYPAAAFGPAPSYVGAPVNEDGAEQLYRIRLDEPAVNVGAAVVVSSPGSLIHPWVLGSPDENDVQGYAGTPVNVNNLTVDYPARHRRRGDGVPAHEGLLRRGRFRPGSVHGALAGRAVRPPRLGGRSPAAAARADHEPRRSGPPDDRAPRRRPRRRRRPVFARDRLRTRADRSGRVRPRHRDRALPAPGQAPALKAGKRLLNGTAADFQEAKNVDSVGDELLPNTAFASGNITVVNGPAITWVTPETNECEAAQTPLVVIASSTIAMRAVRFFDGRKLLATDKRRCRYLLRGLATRGAAKGKHTLRAIVTDAKGSKAEAQRVVRVCP